VLLDPFTDVRW